MDGLNFDDFEIGPQCEELDPALYGGQGELEIRCEGLRDFRARRIDPDEPPPPWTRHLSEQAARDSHR